MSGTRVSLVGLMGAGKSTLGRALAAALHAPFVELDAAIEAAAGHPIVSIFETSGEAAFRLLERQVLLELLERPGPLVLATGGGTPAQPGLMDVLLEAGPVLWLDAPLPALVSRAALDHAAGHVRPLLGKAGAPLDPEHAHARLSALLEARRPYYARGHRLDASLPTETLVAAALAVVSPPSAKDPRAPMSHTVPVELPAPPPHAYPIVLTAEAPGPHVAAALAALSPRPARALLVTDDNVAPLYAADVAAAIEAAGTHTATLVLPAGEAHKTTTTALHIVDAALTTKLSRTDVFIALGGGVIGDLTGFAAAITLRGLRFVQVPTTLLAQVDSSVGGKTGVNHTAGKNLIGAFWQPVAVVASQRVLTTLPAREVRCGLAEAVKHAFLADPDILAWVLANAAALGALAGSEVATLVSACCRIKAAVVAEDEREDPEHGRRAILNFGHTFGHAYEKLCGYGSLTHGEAVALGMVWAARLSERHLGAVGLESAVVSALSALGLPHDVAAADLPSLPELIAAAQGDKKASGASVRFVLLRRVGEPVVERLAWEQIATLLAEPTP